MVWSRREQRKDELKSGDQADRKVDRGRVHNDESRMLADPSSCATRYIQPILLARGDMNGRHGRVSSPTGNRTRMKRITTVSLALSVAIIAGASCERSSKHVEPPAASFTIDRFTLAPEVTDTLRGAMVSPEFFAASNVRPFLGRFFLPSEYETVVQPVMVISHELWQRRFNAVPHVIGERFQLNGRAVVLVGVAPPDFAWPTGAAVWVPRVPR
jgi:hypothetical protein